MRRLHGACERRRVNSCLSLAVMRDGEEITTIEGLGPPAKLPCRRPSLAATDTSAAIARQGQIMSAVALLKEPCDPDNAAVKELMSGNICRCGTGRSQEVRLPSFREWV